MAGEKYITDVVRIGDLPAYRALHGLEVVRGHWGYRDQRPTLICRPTTPAAATVAPGQDEAQPPIDQQEA